MRVITWFYTNLELITENTEKEDSASSEESSEDEMNIEEESRTSSEESSEDEMNIEKESRMSSEESSEDESDTSKVEVKQVKVT